MNTKKKPANEIFHISGGDFSILKFNTLSMFLQSAPLLGVAAGRARARIARGPNHFLGSPHGPQPAPPGPRAVLSK